MKQVSRIFIVSEFVDRFCNSTGYYWNKIIDELACAEEINIISSNVSCNAAAFGPLARCIRVEGGSIYDKNRIASRIWGQVSLALAFARALHKNINKDDVVFTGTNPPFFLLCLALLKLLLGFKWVLLVHDVFPENLIPARLVSAGAGRYRFLKFLFDRVYACADTLIAIGRDMQELLTRKTKGRTLVEYIPNWVDVDELEKNLDSESALRDPGKIVFQFFGNIGRVQGIEFVLDAVSKVKSRKAEFLFVGGGSMQPALMRFVQNSARSNVRHIPSVPFARNSRVLCSCDVALIPLAPKMKGLAVPSKAYFSLAADKPILVIGDPGAELEIVLNENEGVGWFCRSGQADELAALIDEICETDLGTFYGKPKKLATAAYGHTAAIRKYLDLINSLRQLH